MLRDEHSNLPLQLSERDLLTQAELLVSVLCPHVSAPFEGNIPQILFGSLAAQLDCFREFFAVHFLLQAGAV